MPPTRPHRIDSPSKPRPNVVGRRLPRRAAVAAPPTQLTEQSADQSRDPGREAWLRMHATDLISRLQTWGSELEAKADQLQAREARLSERERQFRIAKQAVEADQEQQSQQLERLRSQLRAHARRLGFPDA